MTRRTKPAAALSATSAALARFAPMSAFLASGFLASGFLASGFLASVLIVCCLAGCGGAPETTHMRVERRDFVHRVTAEGTLVATESTVVTLPSTKRGRFRLAWRLPDGARVKAGDLIASFDPNELQKTLEEGAAELETQQLEIEKAGLDRTSQLSKIASDQEMAELELSVKEDFQKTDEDLYSRNEIIESRIDQTLARERQAHAAALTDIQTAVSDAELELLRIEYRKAQVRVDQANASLAAMELRAPTDGVITWQENWAGEIPQVGSFVWPGMPLAQLPRLTEMEAEVFVLEADAGGLAVGKPAEITLEAHPDRSYPGTIRRVSSVAETPFRGSPVQYFGVTVQFDEALQDVPKPGQRVKATLLLDHQENALVVPRQAIFTSGDGVQVYVAQGGGYVAREVKIGGSSLGSVVVEEGLEEGEVVALEPPPELVNEALPPAGLAGLVGIFGKR